MMYRAGAYSKSFILDTCDYRGHVVYDQNNQPQWVPDEKYPNIATNLSMTNCRIGPEKYPSFDKTTSILNDPDICNGGNGRIRQGCCVSDTLVTSDVFHNWNAYALNMHYVCQPIYVLGEGACSGMTFPRSSTPVPYCGYQQIDPTYSDEEKVGCGCLELPGNVDPGNIRKYGGLGLNCGPIMPNGSLFKKGWNLFKKYSWALNEYYQITGICGSGYAAKVDHAKQCNSAPCDILTDDNIQLSYYNTWHPGGRW